MNTRTTKHSFFSGRHRVWAVAVLIIVLLGACTFFRAPGTDDCDKVLSREQMVDILTEMYILEAFLIKYTTVRREIADSGKYYYSGLFHHHQVDPRDFHEALDCYLRDQREMERIHQEVLRRLSIKETEAEQLPELDLLRRGD